MVGIRLKMAACLAIGLLVPGLVVTVASAAPLDPPDGYSWSDCIYEPSLPASEVIETFYNAHTVVLNCGGVRHVKASHGFNEYTEDCMQLVLALNNRTTSHSNADNWDYYFQVIDENGNNYVPHVIVGKAGTAYANKVVTAYINNKGNGSDDDWQQCVVGGYS